MQYILEYIPSDLRHVTSGSDGNAINAALWGAYGCPVKALVQLKNKE
jgi:hypothetical protein